MENKSNTHDREISISRKVERSGRIGLGSLDQT